MKLSEEFTKIIPSIFIFVFYGLSLTFLTLSLRTIPVSIVYPIWAGLGTLIIVGLTQNVTAKLIFT
jgi:small multidrug resistance pump